MNLITESIGDVSEQIRTGKTPPTKTPVYFSGTYNWYSPGDFSETIFLDSSARFISEKAITEKKATIFEKDTVLISCIGDIGKIGVLQRKSSCNQQITGITLKPHVNPVFFAYWCKANKDLFQNRARNAVVPILNNAVLSTISVTFPEQLDDQIRIAHLLGKVEGLIAQRKQHLQRLDDLLKSVFLEMFGDPVRNEKGWNIQPCEKVVFDISSGTSYGGDERAFINADEVGVLKISAVTKGTFDPTEFKVVNQTQITKTLRFVKRGDFLFSRANTVELVAACCIVQQDYARLFLPDKLWVLTLNPELVNPQFFNYLLKNERYRDVVRSLASGGHDSMLNISMKKFMTLSIPCPLIDLQNQFALIVEKVEGIKSLYQQSLTDLETLYGALSQQAFKGELDLSRVPLPHTTLKETAPAMIAETILPTVTAKAINLPDTDNLLNALQSDEERKALFVHWLEAYRAQLDDAPFSVQQFMAAAQSRLAELHPDNDFELGMDDYEIVKDWVFQSLADGRIQQSRKITGDEEDGTPIYGNLIVVHKASDQ